MIKMIVTDLDDTLLRTDKTISERTQTVLAKCREKKIKVVYATGRGNSAKLLVPSELFDGFVYMNGALAYAGDNLVYNRLIPMDYVRELLAAADRAGIRIAAERGGYHYSNFNVTETWPWIPHFEKADFKNLNIEAEKLYAVIENQQVPDLLRQYLHEELYMVTTRDGLCMIMHKEAVKSKGVEALAEYWGIKHKETVAFGDDLNDMDLIKYSGVGVAMSNAVEDIRNTADYICDSNDNDGVAKWLEEYALNINK